ncbi:hypothetical protein LR48_Vigan05g126000 [Vigna angularis]|uniref:Uncharacterized protein n=1 Tax=Phaseolus angularis TaxID=3914 RepID=A0A0L9UL75_PHAAN|nr:hypothetical protein LR48_Vigan05g126000 [Vigna angularis]
MIDGICASFIEEFMMHPKKKEREQQEGEEKTEICLSTESESRPKIRPKGVVDGQQVNIHVLLFVGIEAETLWRGSGSATITNRWSSKVAATTRGRWSVRFVVQGGRVRFGISVAVLVGGGDHVLG